MPARALQKGDALIESMVGVLLMSIIGLGLMKIGLQTLHGRPAVQFEGLAILQMRELLLNNGADLCGTAQTIKLLDSQLDTLDVGITCTAGEAATLNGVTLDSATVPEQVSLEVESNSYFQEALEVGGG